MKDIEALKEKYKEYLSEGIIRHYCARYQYDRDTAIYKLCINFDKETESVDSKSIALKAIQGMRSISPKVAGLEIRERDTIQKISSLESEIKNLKLLLEKQQVPKGFWNKVKWLFRNN